MKLYHEKVVRMKVHLDPDYVATCKGVIGYLISEGADIFQITPSAYADIEGVQPVCWNCICGSNRYQIMIGTGKVVVHTMKYFRPVGEPYSDWFCDGNVRAFDLCDPESLPELAKFLKRKPEPRSWWDLVKSLFR